MAVSERGQARRRTRGDFETRRLFLAAKSNAAAIHVLFATFALRHLLLKSNFNPGQPRLPAGQTGCGRWVGAGGSSPGIGSPSPVRLAQRAQRPRPPLMIRTSAGFQEATEREMTEFEIATTQASAAIARARSVDRNWSPTPSLTATVRGAISHQRSIIKEAEAYLRTLERPIPGARTVGPGHNGGPAWTLAGSGQAPDFVLPSVRLLLTPLGDPIGERTKGAGDRIYTIPEAQMSELVVALTTGSRELPQGISTYKGVYYELADRCVIGPRYSPGSGMTINVPESDSLPTGPFKLHFKRSK